MNCFLCDTEIIREYTFQSLFEKPKPYHYNCFLKLRFNQEEKYLPIGSKMTIIDYLLEGTHNMKNEEYLLVRHFGTVFQRSQTIMDWSVIIWADSFEEIFTPFYQFDLVSSLASNRILIVSLDETVLIEIEKKLT